MAIGTPLVGDLVVYSSVTQGHRGVGIIKSISGSDVFLDDPAQPAIIPLHIQVVDIIARYSATATRA